MKTDTILEMPNTSKDSGEIAGVVHSIETCGALDGPGMRYVVFLAGCPLRCQYCHNPDTQCRASGHRKTAKEVVADALRYRNFIRTGGLTVSGGEPLWQPEFVEAIFSEAKNAGLHTVLDTSGYLGAKASDSLLQNTDLVLLDVKSWLPDTYKSVTGVSLEPTLAFARRLEQMDKSVWIRFVLVPGLTDNANNIRGVAAFASELRNVRRVEILPFHQYGRAKYEALGIPYQLSDTPEATEDDVDRAKAFFEEFGINAF